MPEDPFIDVALRAATAVVGPTLSVKRGAALLYQVTVDNRLRLTIDPAKPRRGRSAFQTDLCVFETLEGVEIPRVVMEFKASITTHDILTYSAKARKHKQVYPYLRYGIVASADSAVPGRFFRHNEALDYCFAAARYKSRGLRQVLMELLRDEIAASRRLEHTAFEHVQAHLFRQDPILQVGSKRVV
jgi:hypothetical protein